MRQQETASIKHDQETDPFVTAAESTQKILSKINEVNSKSGKVTKEVWKLDPKLKRPIIALRIPETSASTEAPDPAGDKKLTELLMKQGFEIVSLSKPSQSTTPQSAIHLEGKQHDDLVKEAKLKGVDLLILGIATSDNSVRVGSYHVAKARVELNAVSVKDGAILATISDYGKGVDISNFVAEKKAIEAAVVQLEKKFLSDMAESWNK